jgi:integrase/recombinase XerD
MAMKFELAKKNFLDYLRIERGLADNSIAAYGRDLDKFSNYLGLNNKNFDALLSSDISDFSVHLKSQKLSPASINRSISGIKSFYKYAAREFDIPNPMGEIERAKLARKLPKALTVSEVESLINSAKKEGDIISVRDHAILEILYGSGARVSEVVGLNVNDISSATTPDGEISTLKLKGKGSKERIVPLGGYAKKALDDYLVRVRPSLLEKSKTAQSAIFLNSRGTRLSRVSAWQMVSDSADRAGLKGKISPHVFRHSYATHLLDGGADIRVVQELLGHSSVTTTQIYTLVTIDKVREAYSTAHPRAR